MGLDTEWNFRFGVGKIGKLKMLQLAYTEPTGTKFDVIQSILNHL